MANTTIQLKKSATPSATPVSLANGELAINYADGKLFYKDASGAIQQISGGGNTFSTINAAGTLVVADLQNDILTLDQGDNITITGDAINDKITIAANLSSANAWANTKLSNTDGVIFNGNLNIKTNLWVSNNITSNTFTIDTTTEISVGKGQIAWNQDDETFDLGMANGSVLQVGQEIYYRVKNQTGSTINPGTVVMASGTLGTSGRILVTPAISNGTYPSKYLMGIATTTIVNGGDGYITHFGKVRGLDTTMWSEGDILYANVSVAGALQNTAPIAPNTKTTVAIVVTKHASNGELFVRPTYGSKLNEDELVELSSLTNGDILQYVTANGRFENRQTLVTAFDKANSANVLAKAAFDFANTLGGGGATVSATAPSTPSAGDLWWNTTYGRLLVYYSDGDTSQWVDATATASGARVVTTNTTPNGAVDGQLWWNSDYGRLFVYYNDGDTSQWVDANPATDVNILLNVSNAAFDKANAAATYAYVNTSTGAANAYTNVSSGAANAYTNTYVGTVFTVTNAAFSAANSAATTGKAIAMAIVFGG